jgi:hypothetical protein
MLIGFAAEGHQPAKQQSDADILRDLDCDRIFSASEGVFVVDDVVQYLRPGDVLAVAELSRLGKDLAGVLFMVKRIHLAGVQIRVAAPAIVPGTALGDSFAEACCLLSEFHFLSVQRDSIAPRGRGQGRPIALMPEAQARAQHMLKGGRMSVNEIARVLGVSPATVYRYFPRGRQVLKIATKATTGPRSRANPKASQKNPKTSEQKRKAPDNTPD